MYGPPDEVLDAFGPGLYPIFLACTILHFGTLQEYSIGKPANPTRPRIWVTARKQKVPRNPRASTLSHFFYPPKAKAPYQGPTVHSEADLKPGRPGH